MNSLDTLSMDERHIQLLFDEAGLQALPEPNQRRVEQVMERAMHEKVIKELSSFMFQGFPAVVDSLLSVASGEVKHPNNDYKA